MPGGTHPIEELCLGDELSCVDPHTGEQVAARLVATRAARRECVRLIAGQAELTLTSDHPVYCPQTEQWAPAGDWALGTRSHLLEVTSEGIRPVRVTGVLAWAGIHDVFDLTVGHPLHNFVANGLLVHNKSTGPSQDCKNYVGCYERTGGLRGSLDGSYGASGSCWTTAPAAEGCTAACKQGLEARKAAYPDAGR